MFVLFQNYKVKMSGDQEPHTNGLNGDASDEVRNNRLREEEVDDTGFCPPLIGREWSRDLDTGLCSVLRDQVT